MEEDGDEGWLVIRIGVSGWMFLLVPAHPGSPGQRAVKRLYCSSSAELVILNLLRHCWNLFAQHIANVDKYWESTWRALPADWTVTTRQSGSCWKGESLLLFLLLLLFIVQC